MNWRAHGCQTKYICNFLFKLYLTNFDSMYLNTSFKHLTNFDSMYLNTSLFNVVRSTYAKLAHLDFVNKKIIELIFKLNIPVAVLNLQKALWHIPYYWLLAGPWLRICFGIGQLN